MTERFTNDGKLIMQNGEVWTVAHTRIDADVIAESLNILIKKNEQLEREYNKLKHRHSLLHDECLTVEHAKEGLENDIISLEKENFELKSIKRFAEKNRINIFHIETAFRNCWNDNAKLVGENKQLKKENEQLKKELFESEKDYLIENYSDNPTRRDEKIRALTEEFKERFGDSE